MRLFLAVKVAPDVCRELSSWADEVSLPGKRVAPENLHFTLNFLGEGDPDQVASRLHGAFAGMEPFFVSLKGLGAFFSRGAPRVIFVKVDRGYNELIALEKVISGKLPEFRKDKPFIPHLTVSRLKEGSGAKEEVEKLIETYKKRDFGSFEVDRVILFSSNLQPAGPVYTVQAQWQLG